MDTHANSSRRKWFPIFLNLSERRVLVIGGDATALRKTSRLLQAGARVEMICSNPHPELGKLVASGLVVRIAERFTPNLLDGHALVIVAETDDVTIARVRRAADRLGVAVNVVDRYAHCTALIPAVVDRSPVMIAIGTGGLAPELARMIRSRLEAALPLSLGPLTRLAGSLNQRMRRLLPEAARRRRFLHWLFTDAPARAVEQGDVDQARRLALKALGNVGAKTPGSVALVGAGPGDPELLTLRALRLVQEADVIVHDGLVDARVLEYARRDAELIDVTKRRGFCRASQDEIQALLVEHARQGARVVRLKGGDPMVFGRGGEELQYLRAHGIDYQVVPGITAAVACGAYAGIPLTHRDHAQSVRLITAHCQDSIDRLDWRDLACDRQTLAFYMVVAQLEVIQQQLLSNGRAPDTPIALVENGTRPDQRVVTATLDQLVTTARRHDIQSPAMLYIGEVAALARTLSWYGQNAASPKPAELPLQAAQAG